MIRNLLLTAFRSLKKNKFFSLLNIVGLGIGMAVFLLIGLYVKFERSYEDFIPGKENIYRVKLDSWLNNELVLSTAENFPGVGPALKNELPGVVGYARLYNVGYKNNVIITNKDARPEPVAFKQKHFLYADSSFLPMMGYAMVKGDARTALARPLTAVISEKYAALYFKQEDPIGKTLLLQDDDLNNEPAQVTGVFKDLPANTHLKFDVLFSYATLLGRGNEAPGRYDYGWNRNDMYTFVRLAPGTDVQAMEARLPAIVDKYEPGLKQSGRKDVLGLQALADIHLQSALAEEPSENGSERTVLFMSVIGLFILVIAWINYINLATARSVERAKEVGVRKVVGAVKGQLIRQFLVEAALVNLCAVLVAFFLVMIALPYFNKLTGISFTLMSLYQSWFLFTLLLLWMVGSLLSGLYPSLVLSSFKPITVLKGKLQHNRRGILLRQGLVVTQFAASVVLIGGTLIIYRQLNYMMNRDLGMDIEQVMVMERPAIAPDNREAYMRSIDVFRAELKKIPAVTGIAASLTIPGKQREFKALVKRMGATGRDSVVIRANSMDYDFLATFKMKLIAGRNFSPEFSGEEDNAVIVTESTARLLGFKNPAEIVGTVVSIPDFDDIPKTVVGVVNDYHQVSLKQTIAPGLFGFSKYGGEMYSVRIRMDNLAQTIASVRKAWTTAFAGNPFDYFFLDEYFNQQYLSERKFGKLFTTFAILGIVIGCLGLLGLSAYTASQRIKEIGIRKVLGASVTNIATMLSRDFLKLVLIAIVIAVPATWFIMNNWLQDFAYRIAIGWWVFAAAGSIALLIALTTVSFQAIKAAIANPVKSLRTE